MDRKKLAITLNYATVAGMLAFALMIQAKDWSPLPVSAAARGLLYSFLGFGVCFVYYLLAVVPRDDRRSAVALSLSTLAFVVSFMCWTMNSVLITYLVDHGLLHLTKTQIGALMGVPILTGSILRLPVGIWTDKYGGKYVFGTVMLLSAIPLFMVSRANSYAQFWWLSLGFGLVGTSFAVGIAYCSVWFPKERQGTALGIFGTGNAGAALTTMGAPALLDALTHGGAQVDNWRLLPQVYAGVLLVMAVAFLVFAPHKRHEEAAVLTLAERLQPLRSVRVWRFGLYYFLVFGGFVALASWLVPYYVSVFGVSLAAAGSLAAFNSLPSGVIRAVGGWMSDRFGARKVMYWVLGTILGACMILSVPRMDVETPGNSVLAPGPGVVTSVSDTEIVLGDKRLPLRQKPAELDSVVGREGHRSSRPSIVSWQEPVVEPGAAVKRKQLLAAGVTRLHCPVNIYLFTLLSFVVGFAMGIGKAAVYRHIPDYFPRDVGVVGGLVGVLGGLGGWAGPYLFGWLLDRTGVWTTCWMFFALLAAVCLVWMHVVIQRMLNQRTPDLARRMETSAGREHPFIEPD